MKLIVYGPARFKPGNRGIGIKANHEQVAERPSLSEITDMTHMDNIEATVCEDDSSAFSSVDGKHFIKLVRGQYL
jgi:hypothetical protein